MTGFCLSGEILESRARKVKVEAMAWLNPGDLFPQKFSVLVETQRLEFLAQEPSDRGVKTWTTDADGQIIEIVTNCSGRRAYSLADSDETFGGVATLIVNQQSSQEKFRLVGFGSSFSLLKAC